MAKNLVLSVTCFIHCQGKWLFIHRHDKVGHVDFNKLNGVGGKVERGEDFLHAAQREVAEETGYVVKSSQCILKALVGMTGGYADDWQMAFFRMDVSSLVVPKGLRNAEGTLLWMDEDKVLSSQFELVDDIHYCFAHIASADRRVIHASALVNNQEKIVSWTSVLL